MPRRRNLPLTEDQLRRFSPAAVKRMIELERRLGPADALAWLIATAVGNTIAPDGTLRTLTKTDMRSLRGVLLDFEQREQLRRMELVPDPSRRGEKRPLTKRAQQARVQRWVDFGAAHRCTRNDQITLILAQDFLPGDACPWRDCPRPTWRSSSASTVRSERMNGALPAHEHCAQPAPSASTVRSPANETRTSERESEAPESVSQGVTRGERDAGEVEGSDKTSRPSSDLRALDEQLLAQIKEKFQAVEA